MLHTIKGFFAPTKFYKDSLEIDKSIIFKKYVNQLLFAGLFTLILLALLQKSIHQISETSEATEWTGVVLATGTMITTLLFFGFSIVIFGKLFKSEQSYQHTLYCSLWSMFYVAPYYLLVNLIIGLVAVFMLTANPEAGLKAITYVGIAGPSLLIAVTLIHTYKAVKCTLKLSKGKCILITISAYFISFLPITFIQLLA